MLTDMFDSETKEDTAVEMKYDKIEKLRKERTNLRRLFTTTCNQFEKKQQEKVEGKELDLIFNKIVDKAERLFKADAQLLELVDQSDKEYDEMETYRDRFIELKTEYEHYLQQSSSDAAPTDTATIGKLKLPKIELKEYDLMPRTWVAFWAQYSRIHEDASIREEDKFQYLLSSLKPISKARSIVESYPPSKKNYVKVIEHLESRFGRRDLLIDVFIRDLLTLVNNRANIKLSDLYDKLGSSLRALETLGVTTQNYAAMLYPVVESCLPTDVLKAWDRYSINSEVDDEETVQLTKEKLLERLMSFLRREVEGEEHRALAEKAFGQPAKNKRESSSKDEPTAMTLTSSSEKSSKIECIFCQKRHASQDCHKAASMNTEERKSIVIRRRCCLVCLKTGHLAKNCRSGIHCLVCGKRHYVILCPELPKENKDKFPTESKIEMNTSTLFTELMPQKIIYLKTLLLRLRNENQELYVRALLDDGSQRSYVTKNVVKELRLNPSGTELLSQGLFGGKQTSEVRHGRYDINVESIDRRFSYNLSVLDQSKICSSLPRIRDPDLIRELKCRGIELTDVGPETPPIEMLIGADFLGGILTGKIEVLPSGITAIETKLGWSVLGPGKRRSINMVSLSMYHSEIHKIWDLESLGITDPTERKTTKELDEETVAFFQETIQKTGDRYEVALPWLAGHPPLYDGYDQAEARLRTVTKRLLKDNNYELYDSVLQQWKNDNIIEEVTEIEMSSSKACHYLPHHPVVKLSSSTTKIRPVFDASYKRAGYASLNDCLSTGPSLLHRIPHLISKFRCGAIGVIADIKQAFLQLSLVPEDRDYLRFLWWEDKEHTKLKFYRHCRVVFGVSSSPFLLNSTINFHLESQEFQTEILQSTINRMKEGFYVDNLVTSVDTYEELEQLQSQAIQVMQKASFELRCWAYNGIQDGENQNVLGLKWDTHTDELYCAGCKTTSSADKVLSKRQLLSIVNSIYDPIGFTSPATLLPKLLLQEAWRNKIGWDEELPPNIQHRYQHWVKHIDLIEQCRIPRRLIQGTLENTSLHVFTDASADAYACCVYLRSEEEAGTSVQLISSKARVAPMKRPTIPRLELLGAAMGARLACTVLEAIQQPLRIFFWVDSMVVLSWIMKGEPWNSFVGNRVKEIRKLTAVDSWRFVPGTMNPADLPSRSCSWKELIDSRWWEGPPWLKEAENTWPNTEITMPEEALVERKKSVICSTNINLQENFSKELLYFSKYSKVIRMVAWMLRFVNNVKNKSKRVASELTSEEIQKAKLAIIKLVQRESPELKEKYSKSIRFSEESGVLKVETKLVLGEDPEDFQRPTVLPDHPIVRLYVEHVHKAMMHSGVQTTLNHIRELYWIPRGRRVVREVISKCVVCKRHSSKPVQPNTAPLPIDRTKRIAAFQVTGVDLAGPLHLRQGIKAWIVLFTCAVYRAIHLELVTSLSSEAFMQAMRRFFARRGRCSVMYSDNGTNFTGTARALQSLNWKEIQSECALENIKWRFSPPTAPWYGGWWERMVRSIKQILRKCLGKACVTYEEMLTLLCEAESVINGRPLTYLSDDPNEMTPITPAHFIQDIRGSETHDLDIVDSKHLLKRVRYVHSLRENLRKRFQKEYLGELVRNPKSRSKQKEISVGEIVLIGCEDTKRLNWPLGCVVELYPGKDGIQRVAKLRVANGYLVRPLQRLYPLEMSICDLPSDIAANEKDGETNVDSGYLESSAAPIPKPPIPKTKTLIPKTEVSQPVKQTRSGRRIVPRQRLDL